MPRPALLLPAAALAVVVALPLSGAAEEPLTPISFGAMGNRQFQAATVGFGIGPYDDQVGLLFRGRAVIGPSVSAGMGGVAGNYAFVEREHVHFGVELGMSVGGGRYRGRSAGLLAAAEPGLFLRLLGDKVGVIHLDAGWYQPVYVPEGGLAGALMVSIAWSPFYDR